MALGVPSSGGGAAARAASASLGSGRQASQPLTTPTPAAGVFSTQNYSGSPGAGGGPRGAGNVAPVPPATGSRAYANAHGSQAGLGIPNSTYATQGQYGYGINPPRTGNMDPYVQWAQGQTGIINAQNSIYQSGLGLQGGQATAQYQMGVGGLQAGAGFDRQYLGNDQARLAADRQLWAGKNDYNQAQYDLAGRRYADVGVQNKERGALAERGFTNQNDTAKSRYQSAFEAAGLSYDKTNRQVLSDNTARGATLTQGFRDSNTETQRQRDLSVGDATRTRDLSLTGNQIGYDTNLSDLRASDKANQRTFDGDTAANTLAGQQQAREKSYMDALASDYGVKGSQISDALTRGIAKLGLDHSSTIAQLANLKAQGNADALAQVSALQYQLLNAAGGMGGGGGNSGTYTSQLQPRPYHQDPSVGANRTVASDSGRLPAGQYQPQLPWNQRGAY